MIEDWLGWQINWKDALDNAIAVMSPLEELYVPIRAVPLWQRYRKRREYYNAKCKASGLTYKEADTKEAVGRRLQARGYVTTKRNIGKIHTFAFIPRIAWHASLYDELEFLGPVTEFDYSILGYSRSKIMGNSQSSNENRAEMNDLLVKTLLDAQRKKPVDWMFIYASGSEISPRTIQNIQADMGIPVVGMCLDDKHSWEGKKLNGHKGLQIDIAPVLDLAWTTSRETCKWYLACNGRPLFMPPGFNPKIFKPLSINDKDIEVSFIGAKYGARASVVRYLRNNGIDVKTYGQGWQEGKISIDEVVDTICRSRINIGMGGIGYADNLTTVKGRDFEIPATSGGVYVTSFNPDLALSYDIGKEIICYRSRDEMLEMIRYYLSHQSEAKQIAEAARERCLREHRWLHRYVKICQVLGILDDSMTPEQIIWSSDKSAHLNNQVICEKRT